MVIGMRNGTFSFAQGKITYSCPDTKTQLTVYYYGRSVIAFNGYGLVAHSNTIVSVLDRMVRAITTGNVQSLESEVNNAPLLW